ncbi:MAG TPA: hypothetical protein VMZ28_19385 [Kofleriaceae bacterium]|nr:hypothetical protein [Kofleriaceae bacterium]
MRRAALIAAVVAAAPAAARGEDSSPTVPAGEQELGGSLGLEAGGRTSPGGLQLASTYLYRLSDEDWFDGGVTVTYGGGGAECFRDRDGDLLCDHGLVDGFAAEVSGGVRRFFAGQDRFSPYARAAVGLRIATYTADDITGLAIPLILGGGVRAVVKDGLAIVGGADLRVGPAFYEGDLGTEPHLTFAVHGGVELRL